MSGNWYDDYERMRDAEIAAAFRRTFALSFLACGAVLGTALGVAWWGLF